MVKRCIVFGAISALSILAACSVGTEDSAVRIPPDQVPFQLGDQPSTSPAVTETTEVVRDEVEVYLVRDERLASVRRDGVAPDPQAVLALLAVGPSQAETDTGLRSALVPDLAVIVSVDAGLVTIDLAAAFTELAPTEQRLALAQITFSVAQLPDISGVRFLVAGLEASVPRGDGSSTDRPVTPADYQEFAPI